MRISLDGEWDLFMGENRYEYERKGDSLHPVLEETAGSMHPVSEETAESSGERQVGPFIEEQRTESNRCSKQMNRFPEHIHFEDSIVLPSTTEISKKGRLFIDSSQKAHLSRVYPFTGTCYYKKKIRFPEFFLGKPCQLVLERTKSTAIYFDGQLVSSSMDMLITQKHTLTACLEGQEHEIIVAVDNDGLRHPAFPTALLSGHQFTDHTQTNWNGMMGAMFIEALETTVIEWVKIEKGVDEPVLFVELHISHWGEEKSVQITCETTTALDESFVRTERLAKGQNRFVYVLNSKKELPFWSEFHPTLLEFCFTILCQGKMLAQHIERTGFRDLKTKGRHLLLNGIRASMRGTIDCAIYPLTGCPPMKKEEWMQIYQKMQEYGLNHYRFHSWCPPKEAFLAADECGMYLQVELPFFATAFYDKGSPGYDPLLEDYIVDQSQKLLKEYGNHPSFLFYAIGNEMTGDLSAFEKVLQFCKGIRQDKLYSQGANNYVDTPMCCNEDEFWVTMRTAPGEAVVRASFSHADLPLGHIQTEQRQGTNVTYDEAVKQAEIPVIAHEIGQYETYPNILEPSHYTGVTRSSAIEHYIKRMKQEEKTDFLEKNETYIKATGALAVQCYKEDIEAIMRTSEMSGFQLLSMQDFPGQGTALIGLMDSFMEDKGLIEPEKFRQFCNSRTVFAKFSSYTYFAGEEIKIQPGIFNYTEEDLTEEVLTVRLVVEHAKQDDVPEMGNRKTKTTKSDFMKTEILETDLVKTKPMNADPQNTEFFHTEYRVQLAPCGAITRCQEICIQTEAIKNAVQATLILSIAGVQNTYPIWVYPKETAVPDKHVHVLDHEPSREQLKHLKNETILVFSNALPNSIEAGFASDFWSYPMFRMICESRGLKPAPGTMGILADNTHPALSNFPTDFFASWQWQQLLVHAHPIIQDVEPQVNEAVTTIVEVIDHFERAHRLGLLVEKQVGSTTILLCTINLPDHLDIPECRQLYKSLVEYANQHESSQHG